MKGARYLTFCGSNFGNDQAAMQRAIDEGEVKVVVKPNGEKWCYIGTDDTVP